MQTATGPSTLQTRQRETRAQVLESSKVPTEGDGVCRRVHPAVDRCAALEGMG